LPAIRDNPATKSEKEAPFRRKGARPGRRPVLLKEARPGQAEGVSFFPTEERGRSHRYLLPVRGRRKKKNEQPIGWATKTPPVPSRGGG